MTARFWIFVALLLAAPLSLAQSVAKTARIGYLVQAPLREPPSPERQGFLDGMRQLGYVEGKNLTIEYRTAQGDAALLPTLATELVQAKVDVLVAPLTASAIAASQASRAVPIVMIAVHDPVGVGLVKSLAHPGGNVTGLSTLSNELGPKRVELVRSMLPKAKRAAVMWNPTSRAPDDEWKLVRDAATVFDLALDPLPVSNVDDLTNALEAMARKPPEVLLLLIDIRLDSYRSIILEHAASHRIPLVTGRSEFADDGALMSYAPDYPEMFRRAATYVDKLLKGANPAELPVDQPTKFELVVNLRTARALGIVVPSSIVARADRTIE